MNKSKKQLRMFSAIILTISLLLPTGLFANQAAAEESVTDQNTLNVDDFKLAMVAPAPPAPTADTYVYQFDEGTVQGWTQRGDGKVELINDPVKTAPYALKSSGRTSSWNGPSLDVKGILKKNATYEISGQVKLPEKATSESTVKLSMQQKPSNGVTAWKTIDSQQITTSDWTELRGSFKYTEAMDDLTLYVESSLVEDILVIDDFVIKMTEAPPLDQTGITAGFEDGSSQGWLARNGSDTVKAVNTDAKSGQYSLLTEASAQNQGPKLDVTGKMHKDSIYDFSVWAKLQSGQTAAELRLSLQTTYQGVNSYITLVGNKTVTDSEWVQFSGQYALTTVADSLSVYVETANGPANFLIDDFNMQLKPPLTIQKDIPSLKDVFKNDFTIGAAIEPQQTIGTHHELLNKHYNVIVAENVMKPGLIQPSEGQFNWTAADALFKYAEDNEMEMRFHTLVWHSQAAEWMFLDLNGNQMINETDPVKREANKELLLSRMENHIEQIVNRYKDRVSAWDVVNEVIDASEPDGMRNSIWYQVTGTAFIERAFLKVRELDPDAKLFINDYNTDNPAKRDALYKLVTDLRDKKGIPIDGVGHQTHINISTPSMSSILDSIVKFGESGFDNQITELDINIYTNDTEKYDVIPDSVLIELAYRYKDLFDGLKSISQYISNVTFWGIADDHTWLNDRPSGSGRQNAPFVFDKGFQAKLAYWAIVDPSKLPILNSKADITEGTPKLVEDLQQAWNVIKPLYLRTSEELSGSIKAIWDQRHLYVQTTVKDTRMNAKDTVELFVQDGTNKHYILTRDGKASSGIDYKVKEIAGGYLVEASIELEHDLALKGQLRFDARVKDADSNSIASWSDRTNNQHLSAEHYGLLTLIEELKLAKALYGTAIIDGDKDEIWNSAPEISTDRWVQGTSGSTAKVRTLWDLEYLYVYAEVSDSLLSKKSSNAYEMDSIEIFLDQNNDKTSDYGGDDGQYRVNFDNEQSYGGAASASNFTTKTKIVEGGYIVEARIALNKIQPTKNAFIGFDIQVNNDELGSGSRSSVAIWNDTSGNSYQNTSRFGLLQLVEDLSTDPVDPETPVNPPVTGTPSLPPLQVAKTPVAGEKPIIDINVSNEYVEKALQLVINQPSPRQIFIRADEAASSLNVTFPAIALSKAVAAASELEFVIVSGKASYQLPASLINNALAAAIGSDMNEIMIKISISEVSKELGAKLRKAAEARGIELIGDVYDYVLTAQADGKSIDVPLGSTYVNRSITLGQINDTAGLTAVLYDPIMDEFTFVPAQFMQKNGETIAQIKRNGNSIYAIARFSKSFSDIESHWAKKDIELMASKLIAKGATETSFNPDGIITRAEFAALLVRSLGLSSVNAQASSPFKDIKGTEWYANAVHTAASVKLIEGFSDGTFRPNESITREQMAVMSMRAVHFVGEWKEGPSATLNHFEDASTISGWALPHIQDAIGSGLMKGVSEVQFAPQALATRAQAITVLKNLLTEIHFID